MAAETSTAALSHIPLKIAFWQQRNEQSKNWEKLRKNLQSNCPSAAETFTANQPFVTYQIQIQNQTATYLAEEKKIKQSFKIRNFHSKPFSTYLSKLNIARGITDPEIE